MKVVPAAHRAREVREPRPRASGGRRRAAPGGTCRTPVLEAVTGWVPPRAVGNDELPPAWGVDDACVRSRTGVAARHVAGDGTGTGDMAHEAAYRLLEAAGAPPVEVLILATATPEHPQPATAPRLAARLGLGAIPALDVSVMCSGFVYGLALCHSMVAAGQAHRALLVGADACTRLVDPADRSTGVVFGDGAGAALVGPGPGRGRAGELRAFDLGSDGTGAALVTVPGDGSRAHAPASADGRGSGRPGGPASDPYLRMRGGAVFQRAVECVTRSCRTLLDRVGWTPDQVDCFVPHQANARILRAVAARVGVPAERCAVHLDRVGNTGAASIPPALADAGGGGRLRPGDRVLLTASGGGLTWGSAALRRPA